MGMVLIPVCLTNKNVDGGQAGFKMVVFFESARLPTLSFLLIKTSGAFSLMADGPASGRKASPLGKKFAYFIVLIDVSQYSNWSLSLVIAL